MDDSNLQVLPSVSARDRRVHARFVGSINGCYRLASRTHQAAAGGVEVFACRVQGISTTVATLTAPVIGAVGETLVAHIYGLGILRGRIIRTTASGFAFEIAATEEERLKLGAKIDWLKRQRVGAQSNRRAHQRFIPRLSRTIVTITDGQSIPCLLIDISRSGAAVSADINPAVGTKLVVGTVSGRIIRRLDVGFAVQFDELQPLDDLESALAPSKPAA